MRRRTVIVSSFVVFAALATGGAVMLARSPGSTRAAPSVAAPAVPVVAGTVKSSDVPIYLSGIGNVEAYNTVIVRSQIQGQLTQIPFTEGQTVHPGDLLGQIDPRPYQAQLDQATANRDRDQAQLANAKANLQRYLPLLAKGFATPQLVDTQKAQVAQLVAAVKSDEAVIESAQTLLSYTRLTAPIDGVTGIRQIDIGNIIHANDVTPLVVITQTEPAAVIFTLPEAQLDALRSAMTRGAVEVAAFDRNNVNRLATGKLLLIDGTIDQATATMRLKALFPNTDERLWPGAFVNARVLLETRPDAVTLPSVAVQRGPQGLFVWGIGADNAAQMRPITVGPPTDDVTIVTTGVDVGDRVVTEGAYRLLPGVKVTVSPAAEPTRAASIPATTGKAP